MFLALIVKNDLNDFVFKVNSLIAEEVKAGVPSERIMLGGFSQVIYINLFILANWPIISWLNNILVKSRVGQIMSWSKLKIIRSYWVVAGIDDQIRHQSLVFIFHFFEGNKATARPLLSCIDPWWIIPPLILPHPCKPPLTWSQND